MVNLGSMTLAELRSDPVAVIEHYKGLEPRIYWGGMADAFYMRTYGQTALDINRAEMTQPKGIAQVLRAAEYLEGAPRRATVNPKRSTYGWKHVAEHWHKGRSPAEDYYIGEGSFILACWAMGVVVKRQPTGRHHAALAEGARKLVA